MGSAPDIDISTGNQHRVIDGECIILPINKYELRQGRRYVDRSTAEKADCVSFRALVADISFEVFWDGKDDYDLSVVEPDRTNVQFRNPQSDCGFLTDDSDNGDCDDAQQIYDGHERVVYDRKCRGFQSGVYKVHLRRHSTCEHDTKWAIRISCKGKQRKSLTGIGRGSKTGEVGVLDFKYPDDCK